jgi:hypothetical protein
MLFGIHVYPDVIKTLTYKISGWELKMKKIILIFLTVIVVSSLSLAQEDRNEAWKSDIEFLKKELPERHKNLFFAVDKETFESKLDKLSEKLPGYSDEKIVLSLQKIIAEMGDDHTGIDYQPIVQNAGIFAMTLYWFSDGLYFLGALSSYESALGGRITAINDIAITEVTSRLSSLLAKTNDALLRHRIPNMLPSIALLRHFDIITGDSAKFTFVNQAGIEKSLVIDKLDITKLGPNMRFVGYTPESYPLCWQKRSALFWSRFLEKDRILYAQYNRCWSRELEEKHGSKAKAERLPSFAEFTSKVLEELNKADTEKFVLDLRFNPGGSSPQGTKFAMEVCKIANINKKGCLFVIIGKRTYSSAVINAIAFRKNTEAILIGEPTSGKPNHFGEVKKFKLPNSSLSVSYSTKYFKYIDDDPNSLIPDITVETTFADYAAGKDPVLDTIKKYGKK